MKHSIARGTSHAVSHKIKISSLKTAQNPFHRVKFLFHKDRQFWIQSVLKPSVPGLNPETDFLEK
jgi:hypothetical protein